MREMMETPAAGPRYYASWTGYTPPIQPHGPIDYEEAEASRAFTMFAFDEQGRAVSFDKWLATATQSDPSALAGRALPSGRIFFAPDPAGAGRPGRPVTLDETQGITEYFRAHVHPDGAVAMFEHVERERMIHHEYRYWEDGQLREWRFDSGGERGRREFDRGGNQVSSSTERSEG